jgi:hypothetical protein
MAALSAILGTAPVAATVALLATVDPEDGLRPDLEPTDVTPGVVGFAVTALVVAGLIGLLLSMVVKLRRVNLGAERPAPPWAPGDAAGAGTDTVGPTTSGVGDDVGPTASGAADDVARDRPPVDPPAPPGPDGRDR